MSLPMRGRGLKFAGKHDVAVGIQSLPMRGRGLKLHRHQLKMVYPAVAPHAGAWIEIILPKIQIHPLLRRSPCGGVD